VSVADAAARRRQRLRDTYRLDGPVRVHRCSTCGVAGHNAATCGVRAASAEEVLREVRAILLATGGIDGRREAIRAITAFLGDT